jgi:hypothetical protein
MDLLIILFVLKVFPDITFLEQIMTLSNWEFVVFMLS